jgi:hypothetical protein
MKTQLAALGLVCSIALAIPIGGPAPAGASRKATPAAVTRDDQRDVMVTVYNGNLGLVKDTRDARLPAGTTDVQFTDVAAQIDPTSVHLASLTNPAGLSVLEQNYEYDLLTSDKLMEKYVGRAVRLYQADGTFHEATLLSTRGPIFEIKGQIHMGHSGRLVLPGIPEHLVSRPTLVWLLRNQTAAPQHIQASYLTGGISWKADYVMVLGAEDDRADLTSWVTIDNKSGATYASAALKLVAGDVHRAHDGRRAQAALELAAKPASADASRAFAAEGLFEYHLYTLEGRTTLKDSQTKQLALMSATAVPVLKRLFYYGAAEYYRTSYGLPVSNQKVAAVLEIENSKAHRLGAPLPRGKVRVYKADGSGSQQFVGEDWIDHTPVDEKVKITMGNAFDVVGERRQREWRRLADGLYEVEWEITLRNHKTSEQTVTVVEPVPGDWSVLHASHRFQKVEARTLTFDVPVPRKGAAKIVYRVRIRY